MLLSNGSIYDGIVTCLNAKACHRINDININQLMKEARAVGEESVLHVCSNNSEGSLVRQFLTLFPFTLRHESNFLCIIGA